MTLSGDFDLHPVTGPSMRSYRNPFVQNFAEPVICASVRAKSPLLQTPMVGAWMGGSSIGGPTNASGVMLARYQFSPVVSEPSRSRSADDSVDVGML